MELCLSIFYGDITMKDDELKGKIVWCSRQKKGIKLELPNDNLCDAYLKKSKDSLKSMLLNMNANLLDWAVDAAYYARYHAIYALLQKCGIKCEIHDCSIMIIKMLFNNKLSDGLLTELENAKISRVNLVYYTNRLGPYPFVKTYLLPRWQKGLSETS